MGKRLYRRPVFSFFLVTAVILSFSSISLAATFTVNPGDDAAAINAVIAGAAPGDTIIFNDGTYNWF